MSTGARDSVLLETLDSRLSGLVRERVRAGDRVALLGEAPELARALEAAGCAVLAVPATGERVERMRAFAPTHVVLPVEEGEPLPQVREASEAAPGAELLLAMRNAGASAALLETLLGMAPGRPGSSAEAVLRGLTELGLEVRHQELIPCQDSTAELAPDTARALRRLLAQLSPTSEADGVLLALGRAASRAPSREPGLLSIVLWAGDTPAASLDETLFSLACQEYRPLELLVVLPPGASLKEPDARALLERHRRLRDFSYQLIRVPEGGMARGVREARGQYLSFLDASCVVYPAHYVQLVQRLREGSAAWAFARSRWTLVRETAGGRFIAEKKPFPLGDHFEFSHLLEHPALLYGLVIDRSRVGALPLEVADPVEAPRADLPARLASLFEPVFTAGLATWEWRALGPEPMALPAPPLQVLLPLASLEERLARAQARGESTKGLRYQAIDRLNQRLRERFPGTHARVRSLVSRVLR
ncbi:MAG TPA: glycosyltransferase family A protein [Archangium sp.]|uniref:glycosyltransferase family A protein n=1 Tax=Archangium sp. TaxID=1872627 RepID=UPI002E32E24C|nr:glycosyltransferase family A protein [Archangium sp.]HEX5747921.1 glycosyltransferase family A protein [Archangium sp.]